MIFNRMAKKRVAPNSTSHSSKSKFRRALKRLLRCENLESRQLLAADLGVQFHDHVGSIDESFRMGPWQVGEWRFEGTQDPQTVVHHDVNGSYDFVWEPIIVDADASAHSHHHHHHAELGIGDFGHEESEYGHHDYRADLDHDDHRDHHEDDDHAADDHQLELELHAEDFGTVAIGHSHAEDISEEAASDGAGSGSIQIPEGDIPIGELPALDSNPGASVDLFLDFDGHFESSWGAYSNALTPVYDIDGDESTFSDIELERIFTAFAAVSEDFAPFDINVTTVEPAILADGNPSNDNGNALRVAIGGSWQDWYGNSSGGVAYVNSFTSSIPNVVYVFSDNTSYLFGETSSHEAGHGFGLRHQSLYENGVLIEEYHPGTSDWQPIMGGGTSSLSITSTWHNGPNSNGPSSYQDDMAILENAIGYRADDHGDTNSSATPLVAVDGYWADSGIIEDNSDVDVFSFESTTGYIGFDVNIAEIEPNLDVVLELHDSAGNLIATDDNPDAMTGSIRVNTTPGTYYLHVTKTSTYGWVGSYSLVGFEVASGPHITSASPGGIISDASIDNIRITFDQPIDLSSLTSDDIQLDGPAGTISLEAITAVAGSNNTAFDLEFPVSNIAGNYDLLIGPNVTNAIGNPMNQDQDVTNGEVTEDQFFHRTTIAAQGSAFQIGGTDIDYPRDMQVDDSGNVYVTGTYFGTADFDPGPGVVELTPQGSWAGYVAKYSPSNELLWVQHIDAPDGGVLSDALHLDGAGDLYVAGQFSGTVAIGSTSLTSQGSDVFAAKLDTDGNWQWAKGWGGSGSDFGYSIYAALGEVHVGGRFQDTVDFDPGVGQHNLTSAGSYDGFILSLNTNGDFLAASQYGGTGSDILRAINGDGVGAIYAVGDFRDVAQIGTSHTLQSFDSSSDNFLAKFSRTGSTHSIEWLQHATGAGSLLRPNLAVDDDGNAFVTSYFTDTAQFVGTTTTLTNIGGRNAAVSKWSPDGTQQWFEQIEGGEESVEFASIALDAQGNPYLFGQFNGNVDFDPSSGVVNRTSLGERNEFLLGLDADGDFRLFHQIERDEWNASRLVEVDTMGNVYLAWASQGEITLPNGQVVTSHSGERDTVVLKLSYAPGISVSPISGLTTSESGATASFEVALEFPPEDNVTIPLSSSDSSEGAVSPSSLTFTAANWNVPQTVTVSGVNDSTIDGDTAYSILLGPAVSNDLGYHGIDPTDVSLINVDNDQPLELFGDSFESGQWNGKWVEDSQNDWFTSTQRETEGNYSAEVDGRATDATLTTANAIDLSGIASATLTFDWLIESGFDSGEYLKLDFFNGTSWTEIRSLYGNSDPENVWHSESIELDPQYLNEDFRFRFRARVSRSNEDANVDNVLLTGIPSGPANEPPTAVGDSYQVDEDGNLNIAAAGLLSNDTDPEGDSLSASLVSAATNGTVTVNPDGSFTYTPNLDFNGSDSFTYRANDGTNDSNIATVSIEVAAMNDAPTAAADAYEVDQDTTLTVVASGVLSNDTDIDGDSLESVLATLPAHGTLTLNLDGSFSYVPDNGFYGSDSFSYVANDGTTSSATTDVSIEVHRVNRIPTVQDDTYSVDEDSSLTVAAPGVLSNDFDLDGDSLTAALVDGPSSGSLSYFNADGSFEYVPDANFSGTDQFTYRTNDGFEESGLATVTMEVLPVNDAPVAASDSYSVDQENSLIVAAAGVLSNDTDIDGDSLSATLVTPPSNGSLNLDSDGGFEYTPNAGFAGQDSFTYRAFDGTDTSDETTVLITVEAIASGPKLSHGVVSATASWQTVSLPHSYTSMVVIATPNYDSGDAPTVTRIRNASGSSFEILVQAAGTVTPGTTDVHYVVLEEGVYDEAGYKIEAVKYNSTVTDENNRWRGESRDYQQSYSNPVVIGQVMSYNDSDWSVFWTQGSSRSAIPSSSALKVGKHVGEDPDNTRADETIGYLVIEASTSGTAEIEGLTYVAAVGGDTIRGIGNTSSGYAYSYNALSNAETVVASQAAMDGNNGGWAVLYGDNPITPSGSTVRFAIDEDQSQDNERSHTTEQVAYFIIESSPDSPSQDAMQATPEMVVHDSRDTDRMVRPVEESNLTNEDSDPQRMTSLDRVANGNQMMPSQMVDLVFDNESEENERLLDVLATEFASLELAD